MVVVVVVVTNARATNALSPLCCNAQTTLGRAPLRDLHTGAHTRIPITPPRACVRCVHCIYCTTRSVRALWHCRACCARVSTQRKQTARPRPPPNNGFSKYCIHDVVLVYRPNQISETYQFVLDQTSLICWNVVIHILRRSCAYADPRDCS